MLGADARGVRAVMAAFSLALILIVPRALAQNSGGISGTIVGDDGVPLQAIVNANRTSQPVAQGRATSAADGSFSIANLPDGKYTLCANVKGGGYLDPCSWSINSPKVQIAGGQPVTGYQFVVKKGTTLLVRVNDPASLSNPPAQSLVGTTQVAPHVILGVFSLSHRFQPLQLLSKDAIGKTYQATIPANTLVTLYITGRGLSIADDTGAQVPSAGRSVTVQRTSAGGPPVTFNISQQ